MKQRMLVQSSSSSRVNPALLMQAASSSHHVEVSVHRDPVIVKAEPATGRHDARVVAYNEHAIM